MRTSDILVVFEGLSGVHEKFEAEVMSYAFSHTKSNSFRSKVHCPYLASEVDEGNKMLPFVDHLSKSWPGFVYKLRRWWRCRDVGRHPAIMRKVGF